jgi:hypothetical protein
MATSAWAEKLALAFTYTSDCGKTKFTPGNRLARVLVKLVAKSSIQ